MFGVFTEIPTECGYKTIRNLYANYMHNIMRNHNNKILLYDKTAAYIKEQLKIKYLPYGQFKTSYMNKVTIKKDIHLMVNIKF